MQNKISLQYYLALLGQLLLQTRREQESQIPEDLEPLHTAGGNAKSAVTAKNKIAEPQKTNSSITIGSSNSISEFIHSKELSGGSLRHICTSILKAALFTTAKK